MKDNRKDCQLKFRLTTAEKEQIDAYCETHDLTTSEFLRIAAMRMINKGE